MATNIVYDKDSGKSSASLAVYIDKNFLTFLHILFSSYYYTPPREGLFNFIIRND